MSTLARRAVQPELGSSDAWISSASDLVTIGLLVVLEGLLSADNALVLAILVLGLPKRQQRRRCATASIGAFAFRIAATLLAVYLIRLVLGEAARRAYLLYLPYSPLHRTRDARRSAAARRRRSRGSACRAFWATVVKVELINLVVLDRLDPGGRGDVRQAVGDHHRRHPRHRRDAAGDRAAARRSCSAIRRSSTARSSSSRGSASSSVSSTCTTAHYIAFEIPRWLSLGLIVVIFVVAFVYAKLQGPRRGGRIADGRRSMLADEEARTRRRMRIGRRAQARASGLSADRGRA